MSTPHRDGWNHRAHRSIAAVRLHPWLTGILTVAVVAALAFSVLIGMDLVVVAGLVVMVAAIAVGLLRLWLRRGPAEASGTPGRTVAGAVAAAGLLTFGLIQLVPYGRDHSNPPVTGEPQWASARTRDLMVDACFSCHSNEVDYPAYASVAPISWTVQRHVDEGREKVNYSEFATDPGEADESVDLIEEGEMPPPYFTRFGLHHEADLSDAEVAELVDGLRRTPGLSDD